MRNQLEPSWREIIDDQLHLFAKARRALPDVRVPCFAHMRLLGESGPRDVLLGAETLVGPGVTIIDWESAPLAAVFFACEEGEEYEVEIEDRILGGILMQRNLLEVEEGELIEIETPEVVLSRRGREGWIALERARAPLLSSRSEEDKRKPFSPVLVQLDPAQRRATELPASRSLLVLGEAGYGKTTVALHRLAFLKRQALASKRPFEAVVIVPTEGLRRLSESMLAHLGVEDAQVQVFDEWILEQARRLFADLPERRSEDPPAAAMRVKRHPAVRTVLPTLAAETSRRRVTDEDREVTHATREDLLHLWGDRELLARVAESSDGALSQGMIDRVIEHTRVQFSETTEEKCSHVDADRLETMDGLSIDSGTPMQDAQTIDTEDCAVLFEINRLKTGSWGTPIGRLATYQHIVVDEAQELAPLELAVVGHALSDEGALTVAGDERQQLDPAACFGGWPATLSELGVEDWETVTLEASYRCRPEITAFARGLFSPETPDRTRPLAEASAAGEAILISHFPSECHLMAHLADALSDPRGVDPRATVAIICRSPRDAVALERNLGRGLAARLALDGEFDFRPGISVTCVADVKGLEFDYVVVPDASAARYPDTPESRRALYVAVTRAIHHLWLASVGTWTPILL